MRIDSHCDNHCPDCAKSRELVRVGRVCLSLSWNPSKGKVRQLRSATHLPIPFRAGLLDHNQEIL